MIHFLLTAPIDIKPNDILTVETKDGELITPISIQRDGKEIWKKTEEKKSICKSLFEIKFIGRCQLYYFVIDSQNIADIKIRMDDPEYPIETTKYLGSIIVQ
jgi:hypothetical protein